jgi:hypothetical protein
MVRLPTPGGSHWGWLAVGKATGGQGSGAVDRGGLPFRFEHVGWRMKPVAVLVDCHVEESHDSERAEQVFGGEEGRFTEAFVEKREPQFQFGDDFAVQFDGPLDHRTGWLFVLDDSDQSQGIARKDQLVKDGFGDFGQNRFSGESFGFRDQQSAGLGHAFDHQGMRVVRVSWKIIVEGFLPEANRFDGDRSRIANELQEPIYPEPTHCKAPKSLWSSDRYRG